MMRGMEENMNPLGAVPPPISGPSGAGATPPPFPGLRAGSGARPRKRRGWMITSIILFCLLLLSLFFHLSGWLSEFFSEAGVLEQAAGPRLQETVLESSHGRNKIAVITVGGIIMSDNLEGGSVGLVDLIRAQLKRAAQDEQVKAVVLKVDSPGGEVLASDEIYRAILKFQRDTKKPVVASMGTVAASGGYYVSVPCQWIVANEMTITGSIGVIMSTFNYRGLMDKVGLRPEVFKSGKYKDMLRGSKAPEEITAEERQMIQDLIDETFQRFKAVVQEGRSFSAEKNRNEADKGRALTAKWADYADGRVFSGREAQRLGFVDEVGDFRIAFSRARKLCGVQDATLVEYRQIFDLSNLFRLLGKTDVKSVKVDVGLDLPKVKAGRPYFLAPTYLY
jgi:protease IV